MTTSDLTAALVAAMTASGIGPRIARRKRATAITAAHSVLRPHIPAGLYQWLDSPAPGSSRRQYAEQAVRTAAARASMFGGLIGVRDSDAIGYPDAAAVAAVGQMLRV